MTSENSSGPPPKPEPIRALESRLHHAASLARARQAVRYKKDEYVDAAEKFKLVEPLGKGGFGEVWHAVEKTVNRHVAIKLITPGRDTERVIQRFEMERRTLAGIVHPNVARFLESGITKTGAPFFAMELVPEGKPITTFCNEHQLNLPQRLRLFLQLCDAVAHAHDVGVIHRDLTPKNVLAFINSAGEPTVKVIDFGIMKLLTSDVIGLTGTHEHKQIVGTPLYVAPERTQSGTLTNKRVDVYSLGVLLREIITARPLLPDALVDLPHDAIIKLVQGLPSMHETLQRLGSNESQQMFKQFNKGAPLTQRDAFLRTLVRQCASDLDWVVIKAMNPLPEDRYKDASDLAQDIQGFLTDKPVSARQSTVLYTLRKGLQRHRQSILRVAATLTIIGIVIWFIRAEKNAKARERMAIQHAEVARRKADEARANEQFATEEKRRIDAKLQMAEKQLAGMNEQLAALTSKTGGGADKPSQVEEPPASDDTLTEAATIDTPPLVAIRATDLAQTNQRLLKQGGFTVLNEIAEKHPKLIHLIIRTESMDASERQYWFDILPSMNQDQTTRLEGILMTEARKLHDLEVKYQSELAALNDKHMKAAATATVEEARKALEKDPSSVAAQLILAESLLATHAFGGATNVNEASAILKRVPSQPDPALASHLAYLQLFEQLAGEHWDTLRTGIQGRQGSTAGADWLMKIASSLEAAKHLDLSVSTAERAVSLAQAQPSYQPDALGDHLLTLSSLLAAQDKPALAAQRAREAVESHLASATDPNDPSPLQRALPALRFYTDLLANEQHAATGLSFLTSLEPAARRRLTGEPLPDKTSRLVLGEVLRLRARFHAATSDWPATIKAGSEALDLHRRHFLFQPKDKDAWERLERATHVVCEAYAQSRMTAKDMEAREEHLRLAHIAFDAENPSFTGKSGKSALVEVYGNLAWAQILHREFAAAVRSCEISQQLEPKVWVAGNLAHACLFNGERERALQLYRENKDKTLEFSTRTPFTKAVRDDFAIFRKSGIEVPEMTEIEAEMDAYDQERAGKKPK